MPELKTKCPSCNWPMYTVEDSPPLCLVCGYLPPAVEAELIKRRGLTVREECEPSTWARYREEPVEGWGG